MSRKKTFWISFAAGFLVAGLIAVFSVSMLNNLAPQQVNWQALQLTDLEGIPEPLSKYRGKVVVLNIWATWCKPCLQEMPSLHRLQQLYPDKLVVLTVSDEEKAKLIDFRRDHAYSFRFLKANTPLTNQNLTLFPSTYLLAPDGEIESIYLGAQLWDSDKMQEKLLSIE